MRLASTRGVLPRTHGSGLFNRGQTQVLTIVTLGAVGDRAADRRLGTARPSATCTTTTSRPISVGEVRADARPQPARDRPRRPGGAGLLPVLPEEDRFPYTMRVVSEVLESQRFDLHGAAFAAARLALMDAGVPITAPVAGIAMGLVRATTTATRSSPTSRAARTTAATWTSRSPAPARASPPSRWT